jgi:hypothetical protein
MSRYRIAFMFWLSVMLPLVAGLSLQSNTGMFSTDIADCAANN